MDTTLLSTLSPADRALFVSYGFGPEAPGLGCVHHAFERHATEQPMAIAVEYGTETLTYAALNSRSNRLARRLRSANVQPGSRVCILGQRGIPLIVAILATLKAGGQYVPLDGSIVTDSTLEFVLKDSESSIVLACRRFTPRVPPSYTTLSLEDVIAEDITAGADDSPVEDLSVPADGIYVIYTSGTTGQPKGVNVTHDNVTNLILRSPGNVGMKVGSRVAQLLNVAFDMAAWEMLGSLANGSTLVIRTSSTDWKTTLKQVNTVIATPTILQVYASPSEYSNIRFVATAGEPCPQDLADSWSKSATFYNSCGPTETTIVNTMVAHVAGTRLSIGRPTTNNTVYILDDKLHPVPIGDVGVLWAGGAGISKGYLNLPTLTGERYKPDIFRGTGTMFNTGDLGRWNDDGTIEHLGRVDDQVKIKGFRVELDGVKSAMEAATGVALAAAIKIDHELVGFYSPSSIPVAVVNVEVTSRLPYYAVPARYVPLEEFPKTSNGKLDKRALRQLAESGGVKQPSIPLANITNTVDQASLGIMIPSPSFPSPSYASSAVSGTSVETPKHATLNEKGSPLASDLKLSEVEKGNPWDGYEDDEIPAKVHGKYLRNLRHIVFTLYRRMFGVVFVINLGILIATLAKGGLESPGIGVAVTGNLLAAILMRQDHVVNLFFKVFCSVPPSWPLAIRRVCARVYHIGGLHSGCSVSATVWFIYFATQITIDFTRNKTSIPTLVLTYVIIALLFTIIAFAWPRTRVLKHDRFERTHRFAGWITTALVWAHTFLLINDYKHPGESLAHAIRRSPSIWMLAVLTFSIILPWLNLRKVPVRSEVLSNHAVRLYFDYVTPVAGSYTRISRDPLMEWHSFATVPEPGKEGYSLVVSRAGDWTGQTIAEPPTSLWVRGVPTCGVLRIVPLFNRVVFVATGSGIGPCAPCILNRKVPIRLLWTSPDVRKTFGDKLVDSLLEANPDAVIYDTRKHGKPDMVALTYRLVKEFNAEAVCIISNQKLTAKVVYGMMSRGIPAFGAIWDS